MIICSNKLQLFPYKIVYVFTQLLCHVQDVAQGQFLSGVKLVWIQIFPSPTLKVGSPCGIGTNMFNRNIIVSEFKLQLCYYIHF